jgi:hypothetical protein
MDRDIRKYIWTPIIAVIGIFVVGTLITDLIGVANAVMLLFAAVGGIAFFAAFYKKSHG